VCLALLAAAGCEGTKPCKQGTLLVTATFDAAARAADGLELSVVVGVGAPKLSTLAHSPGMAEGSIEIGFPSGYPAGKQVRVIVRAMKGDAPVGMGSGTIALSSGCGSLAIDVNGADGGTDGGGGAGGTAGEAGSGGGGAGGNAGEGGSGGGGAGGNAGEGGSGGGGAGGTGGFGGIGGAGGVAGGAGGGGKGGSGGGGSGGGGSGGGGSAGAGMGCGGMGGSVSLPAMGLVGLYELNGNGIDGSGNGNNGVVTGATATMDRYCKIGGALSFVPGDVVTIANEAAFDLTTFSITAFVRLTPSNTTRVIVSKAGPTGFGNFTLQVNADNLGAASGKLSWSHDTAGGNFSAAGSVNALPQNTWVHVAVTFGTAITFFVDGVVTSSFPNPTPPALNNAPVTIGRGAYNGFSGAIDSLRIYNRALSAAEVAEISADR
jgi:hypothetical protein